jgi:hypothetical protein
LNLLLWGALFVQTPKPNEQYRLVRATDLSNGVLHRVGGPAYIGDGDYEEWWFEGLPHRDDGPAVTGGTFDHEWWIKGKSITADVDLWLLQNNISWPFSDEETMLFKLRFA